MMFSYQPRPAGCSYWDTDSSSSSSELIVTFSKSSPKCCRMLRQEHSKKCLFFLAPILQHVNECDLPICRMNLIIFTSQHLQWSPATFVQESPEGRQPGSRQEWPPPPWWRPEQGASRPWGGPAACWGCRPAWPPGSRCPPPGSWSQWGISPQCRRTRYPTQHWLRTCQSMTGPPDSMKIFVSMVNIILLFTERSCRFGSVVPWRNAHPMQATPATIWILVWHFDWHVLTQCHCSHLTKGEDGSPAPTLHHKHAKDVARNVNQNTANVVSRKFILKKIAVLTWGRSLWKDPRRDWLRQRPVHSSRGWH